MTTKHTGVVYTKRNISVNQAHLDLIALVQPPADEGVVVKGLVPRRLPVHIHMSQPSP